MQKRRPPLLYSARKGDGEQPGSVSQGKRGPRVCPATSRTGTSRRVERKSLAPSELPAPLRGRAHWSYTLMLIYFILSCFLQGAQDQLPLPTHSAPGCCFPHFLPGPMSLYCLQARELVGLVQDGRLVLHKHHILPRNA